MRQRCVFSTNLKQRSLPHGRRDVLNNFLLNFLFICLHLTFPVILSIIDAVKKLPENLKGGSSGCCSAALSSIMAVDFVS
jgi:hypothetical protein